ncbi:hypothetical protein Alches_13190 [Alicyclobacillus hesperidum subsp. aegles]|uniref:hypothetical protein n=1 Tax=Alicyclobacillus hesperidum TaxID=89784 RepID=UPI002228E617|nr:hypothetical protein [Alicyclobacillus hesperidum]GLG01280.1 hypothetical protein Alches_13190 [Alicyclobacillus hesperidum subsp. aegles]
MASKSLANSIVSFADVVALLSPKYQVPDIVLETSTCLFILESPHIQELKFGAPVAGASGATMSKHIFGPEYARIPLGRMVKKNAETHAGRPRLSRIGLINVCNIPLQAQAYDPDTRRQFSDWLEDMNVVRTQNQRPSFPNPRQQDIQNWLVDTLRTKLQTYAGEAITLIPCGRFAQKFLRLTGLSDPAWHIIEDVPHPSYNSWDRTTYQAQVAAVISAIEQAAALLTQG